MGMSRQIKRQIERNQLRSSTAPIDSFTCPKCGKRGTLSRGSIRKDHVHCGVCGYKGQLIKKMPEKKVAEARKHID